MLIILASPDNKYKQPVFDWRQNYEQYNITKKQRLSITNPPPRERKLISAPKELKYKLIQSSLAKSTLDELFPVKKKKVDEEDDQDYFCEAFMITGLPSKKKARIIPDSEGSPAPCRHSFCSKLPAFKPEILFRIPEKDTYKLELNSLVRKLSQAF